MQVGGMDVGIASVPFSSEKKHSPTLPPLTTSPLPQPKNVPRCPVCDTQLPGMTELQITNHIDECLTKSFLEESPTQETETPIANSQIPSVVEPTITCPYYMCGRNMTVLEFAYHVNATHKSHAQNVYCPICSMLGENPEVEPKKLNLWAHLHSDHADVMSMVVIGTNPQNTPLVQLKSAPQPPPRKVHFQELLHLPNNARPPVLPRVTPHVPPRIHIQQLLNPPDIQTPAGTFQSYYSTSNTNISECDDLWQGVNESEDEAEEDEYDDISSADSAEEEDDFWVSGINSVPPPPPLPRVHSAEAITTTTSTTFTFPTVVSANYMAYTLQGKLPVKECSICLDDFTEGETVARVECMCVFHQCCIEKWYARKKCCPFHMTEDGDE